MTSAGVKVKEKLKTKKIY